MIVADRDLLVVRDLLREAAGTTDLLAMSMRVVKALGKVTALIGAEEQAGVDRYDEDIARAEYEAACAAGEAQAAAEAEAYAEYEATR